MKHITIIGAGPGGLAAGLLLQKQGYDVTIFEKDNRVGGRSKRITLGEYHFDLGPTFLMYIEILKEVFNRSGFDLEKELDLIKLETLYELVFKEKTLALTSDQSRNAQIYEAIKPGLGIAYERWLVDQNKKLKKIKPILEKPFPSIFHLFRKDVLSAASVAHVGKSVYSLLETYNKEPLFIHSLSFQAKYLGMASFQAPSIFTILPYLEHQTGLYHVKGGLNQINEVMAKLFTRIGGTLKLSTPVKEMIIENKMIKGVMLENGEVKNCDALVMNADFAYGMSTLINPIHLKKYTPQKLEKKKYSVSTWMMYLGINQSLSLPHHEILFADDYDTYLHDLMDQKITDDLAIYIHNPSHLDETLAPKGKSSLFILLPVPNLRSGINYDDIKSHLRDLVLDRILAKHSLDLRPFIEEELIYTPKDWEQNENVYQGAVFNLSHGLDQMLYLRPHNKFEEFKNMYLVGGGTHPGSGLPTIYQSALIVADLFKKIKR